MVSVEWATVAAVIAPALVRMSVAATAAAPATWVRVLVAACAPPKLSPVEDNKPVVTPMRLLLVGSGIAQEHIESIRGEHLSAVVIGLGADAVDFRFDRGKFAVQRDPLLIGYRTG